MFEAAYAWAMRTGSRILFWLAVIVLIAGLTRVVGLSLPAGSADLLQPMEQAQTSWWNVILFVLGGIGSAITPFFYSLVIDRLDVWLVRSGGSEPMTDRD